MKTTELKVTGMTCGGCSSGLVKVLSAQHGVEQAAASHEAGNATVTYDPAHVDEETLKDVIRRAGFKPA